MMDLDTMMSTSAPALMWHGAICGTSTRLIESMHTSCTTPLDILEANMAFLLPNYTITAADAIKFIRRALIPYYESHSKSGEILPSRNDPEGRERRPSVSLIFCGA